MRAGGWHGGQATWGRLPAGRVRSRRARRTRTRTRTRTLTLTLTLTREGSVVDAGAFDAGAPERCGGG
jgi:hypothetical protein